MRVAVTGAGVVGPDIRTLADLWHRVCHPRLPTAGPFPHNGWRGFFISPDTTCPELAEQAARAALDASGDGPAPWVVVGTCSADIRRGDVPWMRAEAGEAVPDDRVFWPELPHQPAFHVRRVLGLTTPAWTVSTACTSGTVALGTAAQAIALGQARRVVVVGVDVIAKLTWFGFGSVGLQSDGRCLPFDRGRTGLNLGEGAAALVLEREDAAKARHADILGYISGYGNATDAIHLSAPDPAGKAAERALRQALGHRTSFGWINAHGTGTPLNDAMEAAVIQRMAPGTPVTANKGALGHTLGAAGTFEALLTLMGLRRGQVPPAVATPDPEFSIDLVTEPRALAVGHAVSMNLAFGGSNAALLLEAP